MSSSIFFRFKSQKEPLQIPFDGSSLSVFEVKRDIIALSKLGDGLDFDLDIYAADTNEKYDDDTTQIPRSSTVIAKRSPASRPGAGRAARYVTGKMPVNAKNAHRMEFGENVASANGTASAAGIATGGKEMTEDEKIQAMLQAQSATWKAQQQAMSHKPIVRSFNKQAPPPDKPLPPGYTCHRCGEKGHWIQACPTNNDPNFDNRPKFKRTTGIPRSFLKVVEKPTLETGEDGKIDVSKLPQGVMYTANGEWVIAEPDKVAWDKYQEKQKASTELAKEAAAGDQELRDRGLECPVDRRMFVNPTKTPCCGKTYCFDCIENALVEGDLMCPNCGEQVILDNLEEDDEMAKKLVEYEAEKKTERAKKEAASPKSPVAAPATPTAQSETADASRSGSISSQKSGQANDRESASPAPKGLKRAADEELDNNRKALNPAAERMNKSDSSQGTQANVKSKSTSPKQQAPVPVAPAKDVLEFQKQMNAMAGIAPTGPSAMNMMNPMMNPGNAMFNPAMMGMNMNMNMMPNMWNMPNVGMMPNMWNMPGMMGNMNSNGGGLYGNGFPTGPQNFNNNNHGNSFTNGNANDSPYMRQPVNPSRQRNRQQRPRSQDFRQV